MISFEPTEEQRLIRDTVADLLATKARPRVRAIEAARAIPDDLAQALAELGVGQMSIPAACGGPGLDARTRALVDEALGFADASVALAAPGPGALAAALVTLGDAAQQSRILAPFVADPMRVGAVAWSESKLVADRPGFATTARRDGDAWILDGEKSYVLHAGRAATYVVFAQVEASAGWDGVGAFVVESGAAGLAFGNRASTVGLDAVTFGSVKLGGVRVDDRDRLASAEVASIRRFFALRSLSLAGIAVGLARSAWEESQRFAESRVAFGKPIGHFQAIAFLLVDRLMDVEGARGLLWRAAWLHDAIASGGPSSIPEKDREATLLAWSAQATSEALEAAMRCAADAVQIHGGAGFVRDYVVEKLMRDAKQLQLCAPTTATGDLASATALAGLTVDPALVLPTPDVQPIFT
ncbi:MAG: acyl-CoA dehydrogenase family protein [Polyangiales bacterium]